VLVTAQVHLPRSAAGDEAEGVLARLPSGGAWTVPPRRRLKALDSTEAVVVDQRGCG
jgi:hypothetical protein